MKITDAMLGHLSALVLTEAPLGLVIDERYAVRSAIARGGMGEVYEAQDLRLERTVALKVLAPELSHREWVERFRREALTTTRIDHLGVVPVHDLGVLPDGRIYYTMKLIEGETLGCMMAREHDLSRMIRLLAQAATIVHQAHECGVIHRDLKPSNLMVARNDQLYVLDWGIARVRSEVLIEGLGGMDGGTEETAAGTIMGTRPYMSPEQATGEIARIDARSDVYSLGAVLYEMLSGVSPTPARVASPGDLPPDLEPVRPAGTRARPVPADLGAVCAKALSKSPRDRYSTAKEFADDLSRWLRGEGVQARSHSPLYRLAKLAARQRGTAVAVALGLAVALGITIILLPRWKAEADKRAQKEDELKREQASRRIENEARERLRPFLVAGNRMLEELRILQREPSATRSAIEALSAKSIEQFHKVLEIAPEYPEGLLGISRAHRLMDDFPGALQWVERAIRAAPTFATAFLERVELRIGSYEGLRHTLDGGVKPESPEARRIRESLEADLQIVERTTQSREERAYGEALFAFSRGEYVQASGALDRYLELAPGNADAHYWKAHAAYHLGTIKTVDEAAAAAIRCRASHSGAYHLRSKGRLAQGDAAGAIQDMTSYIHYLPNEAHGYLCRGILYLRTASWDQGIADFEKSLSLGIEDPDQRNLALIYLEQAKREKER